MADIYLRYRYVAALEDESLTERSFLQNFNCNLSILVSFVKPAINVPYMNTDPTKTLNN